MSNVKQQAAVDTQIYLYYLSKCSNGSSKIFADNKYNNKKTFSVFSIDYVKCKTHFQ